jgi:hypothetical protein
LATLIKNQQPEDAMLSPYKQKQHDRVMDAPKVPAPEPWRPVGTGLIPIGGLLGVGFGSDPDTGDDLLMVVSSAGHGLFDATSGAKIARDRDPESDMPTGPDLACPGLGPLAGSRVRIAGVYGGGLHAISGDGWSVDVVSPEWPDHRVLLSAGGAPYSGPAGQQWWHIFDADYSEFRAAGFSPSGRSLVIATSSDITLLTRAGERLSG